MSRECTRHTPRIGNPYDEIANCVSLHLLSSKSVRARFSCCRRSTFGRAEMSCSMDVSRDKLWLAVHREPGNAFPTFWSELSQQTAGAARSTVRTTRRCLLLPSSRGLNQPSPFPCQRLRGCQFLLMPFKEILLTEAYPTVRTAHPFLYFSVRHRTVTPEWRPLQKEAPPPVVVEIKRNRSSCPISRLHTDR